MNKSNRPPWGRQGWGFEDVLRDPLLLGEGSRSAQIPIHKLAWLQDFNPLIA